GYLFTVPQLHEEKSVELLRVFMNKFNLAETWIEKSAACILATRHPRNPQCLLEEIICDADSYHFGTKKFKKTNLQIFEEWKIMDPSLSRETFDANTIHMLERHTYFTNYCETILSEQKKITIDKLKKK